jgi:hypothetical protein
VRPAGGAQIQRVATRSPQCQLGVQIVDQRLRVDLQLARIVADESADVGRCRQHFKILMLQRVELTRVQSESRGGLLHAQAGPGTRLRQCRPESGRNRPIGTAHRRLRVAGSRFIH